MLPFESAVGIFQRDLEVGSHRAPFDLGSEPHERRRLELECDFSLTAEAPGRHNADWESW
jgi:hypothetical protein